MKDKPILGKIKQPWTASDKQEQVISSLMHEDVTVTDACRISGISRPAYYKWFYNEDFVSWYNKKRDVYIRSQLTKVDKSLVQIASKANTSSVPAMRLLYEKAGEINNASKEDLPSTIVINISEYVKPEEKVIGPEKER